MHFVHEFIALVLLNVLYASDIGKALLHNYVNC